MRLGVDIMRRERIVEPNRGDRDPCATRKSSLGTGKVEEAGLEARSGNRTDGERQGGRPFSQRLQPLPEC
ncbi:MAG: hypothetical protein AAFU72_16130, partial [Pseudomonadota bacterium]